MSNPISRRDFFQLTAAASVGGTMLRHLIAADSTVHAPSAADIHVARAGEGRTTVSLNGTWDIEESVQATDSPKAFTHTVAVPGLVNLSKPAFPEVDLFASYYYFKRFGRNGRKYPWGTTNSMLPDKDPLPAIGIPVNKRNYFWYRKNFAPPGKREVALLKIGKSQFGTAVWLNGKFVGEHLSCWTAGYLNLTDAMKWSEKNELIVRIGAHPAVLPENIPGAGTYSSKHKWTPGIYDEVSLILCDNPVIETIQVAPRLGTSEIIIQTKVRNHGPARDVELGHTIREWKHGKKVACSEPLRIQLETTEEKTYTQTVRIPDARLWSPEDPFLYAVETRTGGDSVVTRFGMREYRFDNAKRTGYLNGKPYYLRGGNIELHLYFEDPLCGGRPWDRVWVKKLIADIPKRLNWNAFRFSLSPVPEMWLDIADEEGILVQNEPILWIWGPEMPPVAGSWSVDEFVKEYGRWMRDHWNHPCIFVWDSSNETKWDKLPGIINTVRPLDLSHRAWDYNDSQPAGPDDVCETHAYLAGLTKRYRYLRHLNTFDPDQGTFAPDDFLDGWLKSGGRAGRCCLINEYAWLWLYPDGTPLDITAGIYEKIPLTERQDYRFYLTAALTEMWRAQRCAVGLFDYEYFGSYLPRTPGPYHFGDFADATTLRLHPEFERYMIEAFKPLGVYLKFWGDGEPGTEMPRSQWFPIHGGTERRFSVVLVNDDREPVDGKLVLSVETPEDKKLAADEKPFRVAAVGRSTYELSVLIPREAGRYVLKATAYPKGSRHKSPTVSCRKIFVVTIPVRPGIGCWFWTTRELAPDGYRDFIDKAEKYSAFGLLTTSIRASVEVTDPKVHDQIKLAAQYARAHDMAIVMDLDVRLARQAFQDKHPDELQEIVRLREVALAEAGQASLAIKPINLGDHYTFRARPYDSVSARVLRVYSYVAGEQGVEPDTVRDITGRCKVAQADAKGVRVAIPCTAEDKGRTACVLAAFTLFTPDVFAPHLIEFERNILRQYADVPLAGACKDEWGFPGRFGPRVDDLYFSRSMAKAYAKRRPDHALDRDLLLMCKGEKGRQGQRSAAINHYMEMNWQRNAEVETAFYHAIKDVFGPKAMSATHPTWYPYPNENEIFKNGLDWWACRRDLAQTDEATPFCARTALAKKWHSPLWYNMYYDRSLKSYEEDIWRHALGGGRMNFHPQYPGSWDTNPWSLAESRVLQADARIRLLNTISTAPIECPVAVVFGHPDVLNWSSKGFADVGLEVSNGLWAEGFYADLIPSSEIALGNLKLTEDGSLQYGPQRYAAAVLYHPQFERLAVAEFFRKAAAKGKTALFRVGDWTMDFEGKPPDAAAALPPSMKPVTAAAAVQQIIAHLKASGMEPQTSCTMRGAAGFPASMMPKPSGQCRLLDGTVIVASGEKDVLGDPIRKTISVNGHAVAFDAVGVAAVRLDKKGEVEAMAAGGLKTFKARDMAIELPERADVALWRDSMGQWQGVLLGHDGQVPDALAGITRKWTRLRLPISTGHE